VAVVEREEGFVDLDDLGADGRGGQFLGGEDSVNENLGRGPGELHLREDGLDAAHDFGGRVLVAAEVIGADEEQNAAKSVEELSMKRIRKDSFYWYSKLIRSNGQDWGKEMLK
jgi:hypothetical protein